jgi:hypothetical protein
MSIRQRLQSSRRGMVRRSPAALSPHVGPASGCLDLAGFTAGIWCNRWLTQERGEKDYARMNGSPGRHRRGSATRRNGLPLKPQRFTRVVEAAMVPKTFVGQMRCASSRWKVGWSRLACRIITVPENQELARLRDPKSGFVAYVPPGSIARQDTRGDRRVREERQCAVCR